MSKDEKDANDIKRNNKARWEKAKKSAEERIKRLGGQVIEGGKSLVPTTEDKVEDKVTDTSDIRRRFEESQITSYEDPIAAMNRDHVYVDSLAGKPAVMMRMYNETFEEQIPDFVSLETIIQKYNNKIAFDINGDESTWAKAWLKHPDRKSVQTVIFDPKAEPGLVKKPYKDREGNERTVDVWNLWRGFAINPKKGSWKRIRTHIYRILCNSNKEKFKYVIRWFAYTVQYPEKQAEVAIVFKGAQGCGKSAILDMFTKIFGPHGMNVSDPSHYSGKFNGHFKCLSYLFADEAYRPAGDDSAGKIKELITQPTIAIEAKFKETVLGKNRLHIAMATNNDWVIPAGSDNRRYFINKCDNRYAAGQSSQATIREYFDKLFYERDNGGIAAMLYDLKAIDLGTWTPRNNMPNTEELERQKFYTLRKYQKGILNMLDIGCFPGYKTPDGYYEATTTAIIRLINRLEPGSANVSNQHIANELQSIEVGKGRNEYGRVWKFKELSEVRKAWDKLYYKYPWDDETTWVLMNPIESTNGDKI